MKILETSAGALTNFEVLDLLRSRGAGRDPTRVIAPVSRSEFKVFDYLEQTVACNQTREIIDKFVDECQKFDLAKAEILNILNNRPESEPEIFTIIEECESRMGKKTEDEKKIEYENKSEEEKEIEERLQKKIGEILETITRILPPHPSRVEEADEETAEGEEETEPMASEGEEETEPEPNTT